MTKLIQDNRLTYKKQQVFTNIKVIIALWNTYLTTPFNADALETYETFYFPAINKKTLLDMLYPTEYRLTHQR